MHQLQVQHFSEEYTVCTLQSAGRVRERMLINFPTRVIGASGLHERARAHQAARRVYRHTRRRNN